MKGLAVQPEGILEVLWKELDKILKAMSKAKTVEEKLSYSNIVKNLCQSMGVFFDLAFEAADFEDEDFDEDLPF